MDSSDMDGMLHLAGVVKNAVNTNPTANSFMNV